MDNLNKLTKQQLIDKCIELGIKDYTSKTIKKDLIEKISLIIQTDNDNIIDDNENIIIDNNPKYSENITKLLNIINKEDCISGMKKIDTNSVDIIIADPPYNIGKDFGNNSDKQEFNKYLTWCNEWISECIRVLNPSGTLYIYGFSEILAFIRVNIHNLDNNINVRWLIWHYTNKVVPSLNMWQRTHESILYCYKDKPIFNRDDVREPYTDTFLKNAAGKIRKSTKGRFSSGDKETVYTAHENGALPRDVIKISALAGGAGKKERVNHPTQKPLELCKKLINASKDKEKKSLLLVPFAGSGSECVAAKQENINFIGFEINQEYIDICNERLSNN